MKRVPLPLSVVTGLIITAAALDLSGARGENVSTGPVSPLLGRWVGSWTNVDKIETGTESFVVQTQVGSTIAGFFCWNVRLDPATCSDNTGDYEPWTGTIDANGAIRITGKIGDYVAKLSPDGISVSGTYQNRTLASHTGSWSVRRASVK